MKKKAPYFFLPPLIIGILTLCSRASGPFFEQQWGADFRLRPLENGDTVSIGAVFCDGSAVYVYDRAFGSIVVLDSRGKKAAVVPLAGIGRDTYCGDDFIVVDSTFIFVNSVDKRFELFSRSTGKHTGSLPLPLEPLKGQSKRSWRIIDRIERSGDTILVGNAHVLFPLERGLSKASSMAPVVRSAPSGARFALVHKGTPLLWYGDSLDVRRTPQKHAIPKTHFSIPGKRLFVLGGTLYAVVCGTDRVSIVRIRGL